MVFEKMLVGYAALNQSDSMLLDKLAHQVMKIGNLLIRSRKSVINYQMNSGRVPYFWDAHLAENLDRQRSSTVLSHGEVGGDHRNVARMMDSFATLCSDTNDLLSKSQRIIVENILTHHSI